MAECTFTSSERRKIDAIAFELSEVAADFFEDLRSSLSAAEWELLNDYAAARVRRALEVGPLLHAIVDRQKDALPYPGRGRECFVRAALAAWTDAFAPIADVWRLAAVFERVEGGEARVLTDVSVLEVMAANRMFASLDEQSASLFAGD